MELLTTPSTRAAERLEYFDMEHLLSVAGARLACGEGGLYHGGRKTINTGMRRQD